jgi:hypothetical protein
LDQRSFRTLPTNGYFNCAEEAPHLETDMSGWYEMQKAKLANYFQSKLEYSRIPSRSHSTKIACPKIGADTAILTRASKLRVVPGIKGFCPKFCL